MEVYFAVKDVIPQMPSRELIKNRAASLRQKSHTQYHIKLQNSLKGLYKFVVLSRFVFSLNENVEMSFCEFNSCDNKEKMQNAQV